MLGVCAVAAAWLARVAARAQAADADARGPAGRHARLVHVAARAGWGTRGFGSCAALRPAHPIRRARRLWGIRRLRGCLALWAWGNGGEAKGLAVRLAKAKRAPRASRRSVVVRAVVGVAVACALGLAAYCGFGGCFAGLGGAGREPAGAGQAVDWRSLEDVPAYAGEPFVEVEGNQPGFSEEERARASRAFEEYAPLDHLGRATGAFACVGLETMPTRERGDISDVHPSGWHSSRYDWVDGESLYNRCHLIAHSLSAEDANERNLVTGTRYLNTQGMLPFEERIAGYIDATGNHVLMRVTPVYDGDDLVARGVHMEAWSVEDAGAGICFNVYAYNVQPGVAIDYATGDNWADGTVGDAGAEAGGAGSGASGEGDAFDAAGHAYVLNANTRRVHLPECPSVAEANPSNLQGWDGTVEEAEALGYEPCGRCNP